MGFEIGGHDFAREAVVGGDGLGYTIYWWAKVAMEPLTGWGRGDGRLGARPLPVATVGTTDDLPSESQRMSAAWLLGHPADAAARVNAACEDAWTEYYWEGNEMDDDVDYHVERVRVPPNSAPADVLIPRDPALPSLVVVDLYQEWEFEHGFYVVLDPADPAGDRWTTWDGLCDLGLVVWDEPQ